MEHSIFINFKWKYRGRLFISASITQFLLLFLGHESCSVMSNSLWPDGLYSPWNSPCQNTGMGSLSHLQGIFLTQGSNPGLLHCRPILYQLSHKGSHFLGKLAPKARLLHLLFPLHGIEFVQITANVFLTTFSSAKKASVKLLLYPMWNNFLVYKPSVIPSPNNISFILINSR